MLTLVRLSRSLREIRFLARGLFSSGDPVLAHIVPIRRCNLSCAYCNEYDSFSEPVPTAVMLDRIDRLAELGAAAITLSGGEPLLHPELEVIIRRIRSHRMLAGLISNAYLMTRERILRLNEAGLDHVQISIDNVEPDDISKKSLKLLDKKLRWLSELAAFRVNINSVLGAGTRNPDEALSIARRAVELGFTSSVGIIHDGLGTLKPLTGRVREVYFQVRKLGKGSYTRINGFQRNLVDGKPNRWRCRAGARYLYVCEDGLVHYCSQQRGYPGIPLMQYTREDIRREYLTKKACAPYCTIGCVHQVSTFDFWRGRQTLPARGAVEREAIQAIRRVYQIESGD
ncbi:MAG TPA: radical SAM protein [Blastocatellia bacterium]|nr:radical SAM protein [Blastocatellia bacterium]